MAKRVFKNLHSLCSGCKKNVMAWPHRLLPFACCKCNGLASSATSICLLHSAVLMPTCHHSTFCCGLGQDILTFHRTAQVFVPPTSSTHLILLPVPFWLHSNGNACVNNFSVLICNYVRLNTCHLL